MKIKGLTQQQIEACARRAGDFRLDNVRKIGNFVACVLRMATLTPTKAERNWLDRHDTLTLGAEADAKYRSIAGRLKYRKKGSDLERWTGAVCFHGHKAFMDEIFKENSEAVIVTAVARYVGWQDYERKWVLAGMGRNVATTGPAYQGLQYREMCDCYGG
jgi:hypothetical protein